jgi:hypothetical protein
MLSGGWEYELETTSRCGGGGGLVMRVLIERALLAF